MGILRERKRKCTRCHRLLHLGCICREVMRGHVAAAKRAGKPDPSPRPCPRCRRTMRGGICPGPDC